MKINFKESLIILSISGKTLSIEKFTSQLLNILKSGGLVPYLKNFRKYSH